MGSDYLNWNEMYGRFIWDKQSSGGGRMFVFHMLYGNVAAYFQT